jgi:hypothetical protein
MHSSGLPFSSSTSEASRVRKRIEEKETEDDQRKTKKLRVDEDDPDYFNDFLDAFLAYGSVFLVNCCIPSPSHL